MSDVKKVVKMADEKDVQEVEQKDLWMVEW
jgi:hypothetical protein